MNWKIYSINLMKWIIILFVSVFLTLHLLQPKDDVEENRYVLEPLSYEQNSKDLKDFIYQTDPFISKLPLKAQKKNDFIIIK